MNASNNKTASRHPPAPPAARGPRRCACKDIDLMDSSLLIGLEMAGVLGLALAWGGYELWSLRKWKEREKRERAANDEAAARDENSGKSSERQQ